MRTSTTKLLAIVLVAVMMASAGCTGWGTDGPADSEPNQSGNSNASDDLEETQNDTNASESDSSDGSDTSTSSGGDDTTESDGAPDNSGDSSDDSSSDQSDDDSGAEDSGSSGDSNSEPQSSTGDDSSPDSDGSDGADGSDRSDGSDGTDGSDGSDGDDGSDGSDGSNGDDGSDDSDGSDGSDGTDGDDGDSGDGDEQLTCDAFDTQPEAQMYYDEAPEERGHLDANNDDIPCESLPDGDDGTDGDNGDDQGDIGASLTVTVEDQEGNAVEGVEVVGIGPDAEIYSAETNADGQATYESLPAGDYEFHATSDGTDYEESSTETITLEDGDDKSLTVTVTDTDAGTGPGASLTVTVEDQDGSAVEGVEVVGIGPDAEIYSTTTNSDGQASYDSLPAGDYEYHVTTDGTDYEESSTEAISLADGDDKSLTVTVADTDSGEPETSALTVTVDNHNGDPVKGASVSVVAVDGGDEVASGTTDSNGTVTFDIQSGEYDVIVEHEDVTEDTATRITVDGDTETSLTLDTSDGLATGVVNVVDQNGDPVEGEEVTLWPPGTVEEEATETREANEDGEVRIELAAGEPEDVVMYTVEVRDQEQTLGIMADAYQGVQEVKFTVDTSENGEPEIHSLDVLVKGPNEDPVEGASVSIVTYDGGADIASGTTNSNGVASFDLENGDYEVVVTTEDDDLLQPSDERLVTIDGEDLEFGVQMQSSGDTGGEETNTLTVHADSAVTVESTDEDGMSETQEPTDGVATFEVTDGGYVLSADGYHPADLPAVDSDTEVTLQDTDGATMDITVTDAESGDPVEGAEISGVCDLHYSGGDSYIETESASGSNGIVTVQTGATPTTCDATVTTTGYEDAQITLDAPDDDGRTVELQSVETATPDPDENETNATVALASVG